MGDFNYRVDGDRQELQRKVEQNNFKHLLENDQLLRRNCLGFQEAEIQFGPTYKRMAAEAGSA